MLAMLPRKYSAHSGKVGPTDATNTTLRRGLLSDTAAAHKFQQSSWLYWLGPLPRLSTQSAILANQNERLNRGEMVSAMET